MPSGQVDRRTGKFVRAAAARAKEKLDRVRVAKIMTRTTTTKQLQAQLILGAGRPIIHVGPGHWSRCCFTVETQVLLTHREVRLIATSDKDCSCQLFLSGWSPTWTLEARQAPRQPPAPPRPALPSRTLGVHSLDCSTASQAKAAGCGYFLETSALGHHHQSCHHHHHSCHHYHHHQSYHHHNSCHHHHHHHHHQSYHHHRHLLLQTASDPGHKQNKLSKKDYWCIRRGEDCY